MDILPSINVVTEARFPTEAELDALSRSGKPIATELTIGMPSYNLARYLPTALLAILEQPVWPAKLLIVDDVSSDGSLDVIRQFALRFPFIEVRVNEVNLGAAENISRMYRDIRTPYVYCASADDFLLPGAVPEVLELARRFPQAGLLCGKLGVVSPEGKPVGAYGVAAWNDARYATPGEFRRDVIEGESPTFSLSGATFYRTAALHEAGGFSPELGSWGDTFAIWAIGLKHGIAYTPKPLAMMRLRAGSFSGSTDVDPLQTLSTVSKALVRMREVRFTDLFSSNLSLSWASSYVGQRLGAMRARRSEDPLDLVPPPLRRAHQQLIGYVLRHLKGRALYAWGTGELGRYGAALLAQGQAEPVAFIDSAPEKTWTTFCGRPVVAPQVLRNADPKPFVLICSSFRAELQEQLRAMGFVEDEDFTAIQL